MKYTDPVSNTAMCWKSQVIIITVQVRSPTNYSPANTNLPEDTKYSDEAPRKCQGLKAKGVYQGIEERKEEMFNT